jgi:hypothetical protein
MAVRLASHLRGGLPAGDQRDRRLAESPTCSCGGCGQPQLPGLRHSTRLFQPLSHPDPVQHRRRRQGQGAPAVPRHAGYQPEATITHSSWTFGATTRPTTTNPCQEEKAQDQHLHSIDDVYVPSVVPALVWSVRVRFIDRIVVRASGWFRCRWKHCRPRRCRRTPTDRRSRKPLRRSPPAASAQLRTSIAVQRHPPRTPVVVHVGGQLGGQPGDAGAPCVVDHGAYTWTTRLGLPVAIRHAKQPCLC